MAIFDKLSKITPGVNSDGMGQAIEEMVDEAVSRRRTHERRWYDNNFFDDGYHFRIISKKTGRVVDTINKTSGYVERAIPRASRQIRGVTNLLYASEPYPVIYPKRIIQEEFPKGPPDPKTGQPTDSPEYEQAMEHAKDVARLQGVWLSNEWEDEQELNVKIIDALIKAAKNSVSWVQVASNTQKQKIITDVFDAFDIVCFGDRDDERKLPFITKTTSMDLNEVKSSPLFDESKVKNLVPDNKYATSEIKDAYMRARYGTKNSDKRPTIMIKETFIKEYLTDDNWKNAIKLSQESGAMEGKSKGDLIMRHVFSGGGITLDDEYIDYDEYPLTPVRFEPGPLYQVPFIERFIPQNKSLDVIVTRLEKFVNSMVVGVYQKRKGENFEVSNFPGGQMVEFETTPLQQMQLTNPGNAPFQVIELLNKYIEEQGASTSVLGQVPSGVKANSAIENLQQQEYSNLKISTLMLKQSIKRIGENMLERAHKDFLEPVEVSHIQDGQPQYFDVIGQKGLELSKKVGKKLPDNIVPLDRNVKIRIEIEPGLGLTMDGKKQAMQSIMDYILKLYEQGFVAPEAIQLVLKKFLETFGYGSTEEFMEAMENGVTAGQMSQNQIQQMQIAIAQTLKDTQMVGPQADQKLVMASKVGTLESLKESGLIDKMQQNGQGAGVDQGKLDDDMVKIYQYASPSIRRQIEEKLGLQPADDEPISPQQADTAVKVHGIVDKNKNIKLQALQQAKELQETQQSHELATQQASQQADQAQQAQALAEQQAEAQAQQQAQANANGGASNAAS